MRNIFIVMLFTGLGLTACEKESISQNPSPGCSTELTEEKVYSKDGRRWLWAGGDSATHFDITNWSLNECQLLDYGYERETIKALTDPQYQPISEVAEDFANSEKVIYLEGDGAVKVYPYITMRFHEVINERVEGKPVMIAYCYLADLAAVYTRIYCDREFTFAVSGYTYADENVWEGLQAFVLWDRETESLWWPLIDRGVSGLMKGTVLRKHDQNRWGYSTWGEVKTTYPDALVLEIDEQWQPPIGIPTYSCTDLNCCE